MNKRRKHFHRGKDSPWNLSQLATIMYNSRNNRAEISRRVSLHQARIRTGNKYEKLLLYNCPLSLIAIFVTHAYIVITTRSHFLMPDYRIQYQPDKSYDKPWPRINTNTPSRKYCIHVWCSRCFPNNIWITRNNNKNKSTCIISRILLIYLFYLYFLFILNIVRRNMFKKVCQRSKLFTFTILLIVRR